MKKLLVLVMLLCIVVTSNAQQREVNPKEITYYNSIELGAGFFTIVELMGGLTLSLSDLDWGEDKYDVSEDCRILPAVNFSYGRQLSPLINLGAILSYSHVGSDVILNSSGRTAGYYSVNGAAIIPTVRFDWLRIDILRCYSRVGLGVGCYMHNQTYDDPMEVDKCDFTVIPHLDVAPFGLAVGRSLYGFAEISVGSIGLLKAGIGYRF